MELVVITSEKFLPGEAEILNNLFANRLMRLHLRKPGAGEAELRELIAGIGRAYYDRIVLHDHFSLVGEFGLAGVHLNGRNPEPPAFPVAHVSRSCHSIAEVAESAGRYGYVFLSPIFDSISKSGYGHAFTTAELLAAREDGIINERVYALGGIGADNINDAGRMGFGGVAILGALWQNYQESLDADALIRKFQSFMAEVRR